mgnify:CR=1 FL=1
MKLDLRDIYSGYPGLTKISGKHLYEGCVQGWKFREFLMEAKKI